MYKYKSLKAGQLPRQHLSFLQNLLNFTITKYFKPEVDDDSSICADERSPCDLSITGDLSMSLDQKVMKLLPPMEKCPMDLYQGFVFTTQT